MICAHPTPTAVPIYPPVGFGQIIFYVCAICFLFMFNDLFYSAVSRMSSLLKCSCSDFGAHTCLKCARCLKKPPEGVNRKWNPTRCRDCIYLVAECLRADRKSDMATKSEKFFRCLSAWAYRVGLLFRLFSYFCP